MGGNENQPAADGAGPGHRLLRGVHPRQGPFREVCPQGRQPQLPLRGCGCGAIGHPRHLLPGLFERRAVFLLSLPDRGAGIRQCPAGKLFNGRYDLPHHAGPLCPFRGAGKRLRGWFAGALGGSRAAGQGGPEGCRSPARRQSAGHHRPPGLHRGPGRYGHLVHPASFGQPAPRVLPRLCLCRLLPHRPPLRGGTTPSIVPLCRRPTRGA